MIYLLIYMSIGFTIWLWAFLTARRWLKKFGPEQNVDGYTENVGQIYAHTTSLKIGVSYLFLWLPAIIYQFITKE